MPNLDLFFERVYRCADSSIIASRAGAVQRDLSGQLQSLICTAELSQDAVGMPTPRLLACS
jgi:hypothetical protein